MLSLSLSLSLARGVGFDGEPVEPFSLLLSVSLFPCCREYGCSGEHGVAEWRRSGLGGAHASTARHWHFHFFLWSGHARATGAVVLMAAASPPGSRWPLLRVSRRLTARRALTRLTRSARDSNPRVRNLPIDFGYSHLPARYTLHPDFAYLPVRHRKKIRRARE